MNNLSEYDNVTRGEDVFSKSAIYRTINDLLSVNGDVEVIVFCPLCVNTFEYKFSLFEHLRTVHYKFLVRVKDGHLLFKECPFCNAKFYGEHLAAKHSLLYHSKAIRELFVNGDSRCTFCGIELSTRDYSATVGHIEKMHFVDFEEEFKLKFSTSVSEMTFSDFIKSAVSNQQNGPSCSLTDANDNSRGDESVEVGVSHSGVKDFIEASTTNCFDFTELKMQLKTLDKLSEETSFKRRSIMKNIINVPVNKSVRRVLRFDVPDNGDMANKENSVLHQKLSIIKCFNSEGNTTLQDSCDRQKLLNNSVDDWCVVPKHCSTPNNAVGKILSKNENYKHIQKANEVLSKCNVCKENHIELEFKCGKCRKLFKENLELVCHIKNSHRKFGLKSLKPSYTCAICNAKFFKNCFLKKHHRLHRPY